MKYFTKITSVENPDADPNLHWPWPITVSLIHPTIMDTVNDNTYASRSDLAEFIGKLKMTLHSTLGPSHGLDRKTNRWSLSQGFSGRDNNRYVSSFHFVNSADAVYFRMML